MSGSSLDGVDLACCRFGYARERWEYRLLAAETLPYPAGLTERLMDAWRLESTDIKRLDLEMGEFFARLVRIDLDLVWINRKNLTTATACLLGKVRRTQVAADRLGTS